MPLPSTIADLSTTPGSNSPGGGETPGLIDDYLRLYSAFIAQLRDGTGFTAVKSNDIGSASAPAFSFVSDANTGIYSPTADTLAATTGGTERVRIDASGNVGIGVTSPSGKLHVSGNIQQENANYVKGKLAAGTETRLFGLTSGDALYIGGIDAAHSGTVFLRGGTAQATLDASGNFGIGVTSPTVTVDANGAIRTRPVTVATLPSAATAGAGSRHFVTDSNATTFAAVVAGGGANGVPVYSDGTNWRIG